MPSDLRLTEIAAIDGSQDRLKVRDGRTAGANDFNARAREGLCARAGGFAVGVERLQADDGRRAPARTEIPVVRDLCVERADACVVVEHIARASHGLRRELIDVVCERREGEVAAGRVVVANGRAVGEARRLVVRHVKRAQIPRRGGFGTLACRLAHGLEGGVAELVAGPAAHAGALNAGQVAVRAFGPCHKRQRVGAVDVVVRLRCRIADVVVVVVEPHPEVLERNQRQVGGRLDPPYLVAGERAELLAAEGAVLAEEATAGEVGDGVAAAGDGAAKRCRDAGLGQVIPKDVGRERHERRDGGAVENAERIGLGLRAREAGVRRHAIGEGDRILLGRERPARHALRADFGKDLDHAVGRFGAVEGRGCRPLEHFNAFDRVGVDVIQSGRGATTAAVALIAGAVVHTDAIDEDDRLVGLRQRRVAANADLRALPRQSTAKHADEAWLTGGEQVGDVVDRGVRRRRDNRDCIAEPLGFGLLA